MRRCPKRESFVETPDGVGTVTDVNFLREKVKVRLEDAGSDAAPKQYLNQEIRIVRNGKGKRPEDYVAPPREELEALRYIPPREERKVQDEPKGSLAQALEDLFAGEAKRAPTRKPSHPGNPRPRKGQGGQPRQAHQGGKPRPRRPRKPREGEQ